MRLLPLCLALLGCRVDNALDNKAGQETGSSSDSGALDCVADTEVCDGQDNDCDGDIDEDLDQTWHADTDNDGYGDPAESVDDCAQPDGFVDDDSDCDDTNPAVHPGADELCNDRDDDCDTLVDEDLPLDTWYADNDGDGWGDPDAPVDDCAQPEGTTDQLADCDDGDSTRHLCESCWEVLEQGLSTGDGSYTLDPPGCAELTTFCDMTTDGGGWTQMVDLDVAADGCPGDWQPVSLSAASVCARSASTAAERIRTATFDTCDIPFQAVLGNAVLYQNGSTDAFGDVPSTSIDEAYGDVVSVTLGDPRAHVFTWVFGFLAGGTDDSNCPAIGGASPPGWVGTDYLCATGNPSSSTNERIWYETALFGADWWQVALSASTTDDLEVRLMATHDTSDEDVGVEELRLRIR